MEGEDRNQSVLVKQNNGRFQRCFLHQGIINRRTLAEEQSDPRQKALINLLQCYGADGSEFLENCQQISNWSTP